MDSNDYLVSELLIERHVKYLKRFISILPESVSFLDTNRLMVAFFALSGLDLLKSLHVLSENEKNDIIQWIYSLQIPSDNQLHDRAKFGFEGSSSNGKNTAYNLGHVALTYTGISCLLILGDDLSRVNKSAILRGLAELQMDDGSFCAAVGNENDMRMVFCAMAICYFLNDFSSIDVNRTVDFIRNCLTYEGAFGLRPGQESHGGSTYCAVASLYLLNKLDDVLHRKQIERLKIWCLMKQESGFKGRCNKEADTCYSFWVGATLKLLNSYQFVKWQENVRFIVTTQNRITGGFGKNSESSPDPLHTYLGISGLSLVSDLHHKLIPVNPALNISERVTSNLKVLHKKWSNRIFL